MKKKLLAFVCAVFLVGNSALVTFAADESPAEAPEVVSTTTENITVTDGVVGSGENSSYHSTDGKPYPCDISYSSENGVPVIIKSYRVPVGVEPESLIDKDFEEDGILYKHQETLQKETSTSTETKTISQTVTFATDTKDDETVRGHLSPIIEFNEGGFSGQLRLDYGSIMSTESGRVSYSYPITKTVQLNGEDWNDYTSLEKNIGGLSLQAGNWASHGTSPEANSERPSNYTSNAVYSGYGTGSRVTGYENTAVYIGDVSRTLEGDTLFSFVYKGEVIEPVKPPRTISTPAIILTAIISLLFGGLVAWALLMLLPRLFAKRKGSMAETTEPKETQGPVPLD